MGGELWSPFTAQEMTHQGTHACVLLTLCQSQRQLRLPGLQTQGPAPCPAPLGPRWVWGAEIVGEMLPRAQLIGPGVRSALGGPMEEVSIQEAVAGGGRSSPRILEAGVDDMHVLSRETLPWMWEAGVACVLGPDGHICAATIASVTMTTC